MVLAKYRVGDFVEFNGETWMIVLCRIIFGTEHGFLYDLRRVNGGFACAIEEKKLCPTTLATTTD